MIKLLKKINEKFDLTALFPKSAPLMNNNYVKNISKFLVDDYDINKEIKILG